MPHTASHGLTKAGLTRLNKSIEAFIYCILGSQVDTRISILDNTGGAREAQLFFKEKVKNAIHLQSISKSIKRLSMRKPCKRCYSLLYIIDLAHTLHIDIT